MRLGSRRFHEVRAQPTGQSLDCACWRAGVPTLNLVRGRWDHTYVSQNPLDDLEADLLSGKPVADALRRCVILGGRLKSPDLRDWATRELQGYIGLPDEEVPGYRTIGAIIQVDAIVGHNHVRHQRISPSELPDFAQEHIGESYTFRDGIGEIEAMITSAKDNSISLSFPAANDLARWMDHASGNPYQQILNIYWSISASNLMGIVDQVKSKLAELIGELRAGTPANAELPGPATTEQAMNVVFNKAKRVSLVTAQAASGSTATIATTSEPEPKGFWSNPRWLGVTGALGAIAIYVAIALAEHVWPFA
jgi:hypothetical protein